MIFNEHLECKDRHAFLSPSNPHWLNYNRDKLIEVYHNHLAKERGTRLHAYAAESIDLAQHLPRSPKTLNMYVNDAIGYKMFTERVLKYSKNCFGTTDAIVCRNKLLRVHDLKTGVVPANMDQLYVYAALYCLEYGVNPKDIDTELRIYQNNEIFCENPHPADIEEIMEKIRFADEVLEYVKEEEGVQ